METLIVTYAFAATMIVGYASCLVIAARRASRRLHELQAQSAHASHAAKLRRVA